MILSRCFLILKVLLCLIGTTVADNSTDDDTSAYNSDPILQYRPPFARSMPIQILVIGVVLTLVAVLFVHLLFTLPYHWPLAPVNCILQFSGVITLSIALIAMLCLVLRQNIQESQQWPYMLSYIAVEVPPDIEDDPSSAWPMPFRALWLVTNASTSALVQITHIQFLTFLYPSRLEARLIFCLLAPLAIASAISQILPIEDNVVLLPAFHAIRNICNATLSVLFSASLLIWGFLVNRKSAWRTDGGTFAFGAGAICLALMATVLNFMYIPTQEEYVWMPVLIWAVILWQNFLGWWWWIGAGMGVGEVDELLKIHEKRERKRRERNERKRERQEKARLMWQGMTSAFVKEKNNSKHDRNISSHISDDANELDRPLKHRKSRKAAANVSSGLQNTHPPVDCTATVSSLSPPKSLLSRIGNTRVAQVIQGWYAMMRQAHLTAARRQAVERVERIQAAYGREGGGTRVPSAGLNNDNVVGWGLGSFGMRECERNLSRAQDAAAAEDSSDDDNVDEPEDMTTRRGKGKPKDPQGNVQSVPSSVWWRGPFARWRLKDSTVYS